MIPFLFPQIIIFFFIIIFIGHYFINLLLFIIIVIIILCQRDSFSSCPACVRGHRLLDPREEDAVRYPFVFGRPRHGVRGCHVDER